MAVYLSKMAATVVGPTSEPLAVNNRGCHLRGAFEKYVAWSNFSVTD